MIISLIAAVAENRVIGRDNTLIWRQSEDLKYFKRTTLNHCIIMGRKNYQDIGRPLPKRTNIVVTRQIDFVAEGCLIAHSLQEALELAAGQGETEAFIIGGGQIYTQGLALSDKLYITEIHNSFDGDVFFPELGEQWIEEFREGPFPPDEKNQNSWSFVRYTRK